MGLELSEVSFAYYVPKKMKQPIHFSLNNISLNINANDEFVAIVGHTGSGKSTLVQLFNALNFPSKGTVVINNNKIIKDIKAKEDTKKYRKQLIKQPKIKFPLKPLRKYTGLVFQFPEYQLFEETVYKDIIFGPKNFNPKEDYKYKVIEISKLMGIEDLLEKSPFALSGGQMRKVAIAGILISDPDILVLDEPTVGLDPITKKDLLQLLTKINKELHKTIIIITHDMDVVSEYVKRVIVLKKGSLMYDGSKEELFKKQEIIESCNLALPNIVTIMNELNHKLNLNLDIYKYNIDDAFVEIKSKVGEKHE